jgi:tRNA (guanosine-2'-O-)-methyltransferase
VKALGVAACLALALSGCAGAKPTASTDAVGTEAPHAGPRTIEGPLEACAPTGPEICENAVDDNCNGVIDEGCEQRGGLVQFVIAWDKPGSDVDLRVVDPNGELVEVGRAAESGLLKERDCPGRSGECRGKNLENVFLEGNEPLRGSYRVKIRLESLGGETPPISVRFGARLGQKTFAADLTLERPEAERDFVLAL